MDGGETKNEEREARTVGDGVWAISRGKEWERVWLRAPLFAAARRLSRPVGSKRESVYARVRLGEGKKAYVELLVISVIVEVTKEGGELVLVAAKNGFDLRRLLRIGDEDLYVERRRWR
jgi:hypothetical protein